MFSQSTPRHPREERGGASSKDVTINRDSVRGRSLYECMPEGNLLSLKMFRWYFFFSSCLCLMHIKGHKGSAAYLLVMSGSLTNRSI